MKTNTSTLFGDSLGRFLAKAGTSEGAKRGWETRRAGGEESPVAATFNALDELGQRIHTGEEYRGLDAASKSGKFTTREDAKAALVTLSHDHAKVQQMVEDLEYDAKEKPLRDPEAFKDHMELARKMAAAAGTKLQDTVDIFGFQGGPRPETTWRRAMPEESRVVEPLQGARMFVAESIRSLRDAAKTFRNGNDEEKAKGKKPPETTDTDEPESAIGFGLNLQPQVEKAGTSEGAKLGWESRRGGAPQVTSQPTEAEQASRLQGTPAKFVGGPPAPKKMMENLAGEAQDETHGYFGPGTGRNAALDEDVGEALQALGVKPKEAKEFLYSSMGRHLADSISTLKPGEGKEEIRQRAERHLNSHRKWATGASPKPLRLPLEPFKLPLRTVSETRKTNPIGPFVLGLDKMEFEEDEHPRDASGKFAPAGEAASGKPAGEEKPKEPKPEKPPSPAKMKDSLSEKGVHADKVSGKDGKYKAYFGFFYRSGESSQEKADKIQAALPEAKIIRHEEHSAPFRGGAPVERQQHWMVEFEYAPKKKA